MARRKIKAPYSDMRAYDQGSDVRVTIGSWGVYDFMQQWPASGLDSDKGISFIFEKRNGDLVDIGGQDIEYADGAAVSALADDAWNYAVDRLGLAPHLKKGSAVNGLAGLFV